MGSIGFFTNVILLDVLWPWGRPEMSTRVYILGSKGARYVGLTILPTSCSKCLEFREASGSWNPKGMSRPVMG